MEMIIPQSFKEEDIRFMASGMGHEGFHAAVHTEVGGHSWSCNTAANEAFAYSFGYRVSKALKYDDKFTEKVKFSNSFRNVTPSMSNLGDVIDKASITLYEESVNEKGYHQYHDDRMGGVMWNWPGLFGSGRNEFLAVAQSVWIN
jgi:hypothetical protein